MAEAFDVMRFAAAARAMVKTESGPRPAVEREMLAEVLSRYCRERGIDQEALMREIGMDPSHPVAQERFRNFAMMTVDRTALVRVLSSDTAPEDDVA
ncbi:MAG TPA: hypothetical protein VKT25_10035 [Ktedonobacteraceae bacterium]|nr:hypothetical protein [Ktedonobacteraceae bacterium]